MELLGRPEPDLKPIIDSFLNELREIQKILEDYYKRFHWINEKFMLKSIYRKFNCLEYENEIIALNDSITMVIDQLTPYEIKNSALPSSRFDSQILNKKLFDFKEKYPSYSDMAMIRQEFNTLDREVKEFLRDPTKRSQLIEFFRNSFPNSELIHRELDQIRQDTFNYARIHSQHIPVVLDYNLVLISRMHQEAWNMCQMYKNKIEAGDDLSSGSQTIRMEKISMFVVILLIIINVWF